MTVEKFIRWSLATMLVWVLGSAVLCITLFIGSAVFMAISQSLAGK